MNAKSEPRLIDNVKRLERHMLERIRGPAIALMRKIYPGLAAADAAPVVNIRAENGQTIAAGATPAAPVLLWGSGGFELSACIDPDDQALAVPLESDHAGFYGTGKPANPASTRQHDRGLAALLTFAYRKAAQALPGQLYLGHKAAGVWIVLDREQKTLTVEAPAIGGKIIIGAGAGPAYRAARTGDTVVASDGFAAWGAAVTVSLTTLGVPPSAPFDPDMGTIGSGSATTFIR